MLLTGPFKSVYARSPLGQSSLPELLAHDVPVEVPGDRPGDDEREDPGLSGVVESQKSVEQRHLAESRSEKK